MRRRVSWLLSLLVTLLFLHATTVTLLAEPQDRNQAQALDKQYGAAAAKFDAGDYSAAAVDLERLLPYAPNSFEMHEMLGLAYAAQAQYSKAIPALTRAVELKPNDGAAHTNLAKTLAQAGQSAPALEHFRKAFALEPNSYDANHNLGEFLVQLGKLADARPLLEQAQRIDPSSYNNGYDLALAAFLTGNLVQARQAIQSTLRVQDTGEAHNLLAQIEEKAGNFLAAAVEFDTAAHKDPSEDNLFDWGGELLLHRTYDPAIAVFEQATLRYPSAPRLWIGLGMALNARGKYDDAVKALIHAADLNPTDPRCYLFLSKAYSSSPNQAEAAIQAFRRYAELKPRDALAQYYYATGLWKGKRLEDSSVDLQAVEALLRRAIALDDALPEAHVQLGGLYSDQHRYAESIPQYLRAIELDNNLPDAHYRLGQAYVHTDQKDKAQAEFAIYQQQRAEHLAELDKERAEVQQFVAAEKDSPAAQPATKPETRP